MSDFHRAMFARLSEHAERIEKKQKN